MIRYPGGVTKLGVLQRGTDWTAADGALWRWDDWHGWRFQGSLGYWEGSFQTVEGHPPYMEVVS